MLKKIKNYMFDKFGELAYWMGVCMANGFEDRMEAIAEEEMERQEKEEREEEFN